MGNTECDQRSCSVLNASDFGVIDLFPNLEEHFSYSDMCDIAQPIQTKAPTHPVPAEFIQRESESVYDSPMVQLFSQNFSEDSGTNNASLDSLSQPIKSVTAKPEIIKNKGTKTKKKKTIERDESSHEVLIKSIINKRFEASPVECCNEKISSRKQLLAHFRKHPHIIQGKHNCPHTNCIGKDTEDYNLLAEHYMTHFDAHVFKCPNKGCTGVYQSSRVLVHHYLKKCTYND
ncbi:hypothetical protein Noda2021_01550 [Candidatus Dependentiae bacterium Noda2021]|nr:hypothetical protein Noda2021_01550 [Candidatus Dependentiae bacterium Noda2021]